MSAGARHDWELGIRPVGGGKDSVPDGTVAGVAITLLATLIRSGDPQRHQQCSCMHSTWILEGVAVEWDLPPYSPGDGVPGPGAPSPGLGRLKASYYMGEQSHALHNNYSYNQAS